MISLMLKVLGAITAITFIYRICNFVSLYFLHQSTLPRYLRADKNAYALVTGASDGIGHATAKALQRRGFNIILHGRNPEKLNLLSKQMNQEYPNQRTVTVAADAADVAPSVQKIAKAVQDIERSGGRLTVLVNNVGGMSLFGVGTYTPFKDMPSEVVNKAVDLNAKFPTLLTHALLPRLIARQLAWVDY